MELVVRHSGSGGQLVKLFLCLLPGVLAFTVPMAILVGVLLGLGRMSADSEIIALTALGIGRKRILLPVAVLALTGVVITASHDPLDRPALAAQFPVNRSRPHRKSSFLPGTAARFR